MALIINTHDTDHPFPLFFCIYRYHPTLSNIRSASSAGASALALGSVISYLLNSDKYGSQNQQPILVTIVKISPIGCIRQEPINI